MCDCMIGVSVLWGQRKRIWNGNGYANGMVHVCIKLNLNLQQIVLRRHIMPTFFCYSWSVYGKCFADVFVLMSGCVCVFICISEYSFIIGCIADISFILI